MDFKDKVILITGACTPIGTATAIQFADLGATLSLVDSCSKNNLNLLAEKCAAANPLVIVADVTSQSEDIIRTTIQHFGQLDVLINNSGKLSTGSFETTTLAQLNEVLLTNVQGIYHLTMLAVPHLVKTKGNIVTISSIAGIRAIANYLPYCMAQAAVDHFTRCIAIELAPKGIRVNSVNPDGIAASYDQQIAIDSREGQVNMTTWKEKHPLGRLGSVQDVAEGIIFLAKESSASFVTGIILPIDGGASVLCSRR